MKKEMNLKFNDLKLLYPLIKNKVQKINKIKYNIKL